MNKLNSPSVSKINWTALVMAMIGLAVALDMVPPAAEEPLTQITMILGPTLIAIFRTWFTEK